MQTLLALRLLLPACLVCVCLAPQFAGAQIEPKDVGNASADRKQRVRSDSATPLVTPADLKLNPAELRQKAETPQPNPAPWSIGGIDAVCAAAGVVALVLRRINARLER